MAWWTYFVGLGLSWANLEGSYDNPSRSVAVDLAAVHLVDPGVGYGVRVRGSHVDGATGDRGGSRSADTRHDFYTFDAAAVVQFSPGRVVFEPWLGLRFAS